MNPLREAIQLAVYKALIEHDRAKRLARELRVIKRGGPTIKRGTGRSAQARFVTDAVMAVLAEWPE